MSDEAISRILLGISGGLFFVIILMFFLGRGISWVVAGMMFISFALSGWFFAKER